VTAAQTNETKSLEEMQINYNTEYMKKILCPTDFSYAAQNAVAYAAELAHETNSSLTLLHVSSLLHESGNKILHGKNEAMAGVADQLEIGSRQVSKTFKINCHAELKSGTPVLNDIIHLAGQEYDLIVMGSNGTDNLYQYFFGSNAYNVALKSEIPLLLIPAESSYSKIGRIVYAFDYLKRRTVPLLRFIPVVKALQAELTVLEVITDKAVVRTDNQRGTFENLVKKFYEDDLHLQYETVYAKNVANAIDRHMQQKKYDALALCSVHHNIIHRLFHTSVIKYISAICHYPVFIFPQ